MTNAEINLRSQKNQADIASADRKSKEAMNAANLKQQKYDTDSKFTSAKLDRAQKERSDARSADVQKRGQNLKAITDVGGSIVKTVPGLLALNDPKWWTQGFSESEQSHVIPTNWKIDAYEAINKGSIGPQLFTRDICFYVKNMIPNWDPDTTGYIPSHTDPVNRSFQMLKTQLQKKAGYNLAFQASDIGLLLLSCREIVSLSHFIAKCLRYTIKGTAYNSAEPAHIFKLLGIDYNDTVTNYNSYRGELEAILPLMDVLPTPELPLYYRAAQLFGSTWMDDNYPSKEYQYKSTKYHTRPLGFNILSDISADKTSELVFVSTVEYTTLGQYLELLRTCINQILKRDDFVEITGRLSEFYPRSWSYRDIDTSTPQAAIYEPYTLAQIHNSVVPELLLTTELDNVKPYLPDFTIATTESGLIYQKNSTAIRTVAGGTLQTQVTVVPTSVDLNSDTPVSIGAVIDATRMRLGFKFPAVSAFQDTDTSYWYLPTFLMNAWDFMCNPLKLSKDDQGEFFASAYNSNDSLSPSDAVHIPICVRANPGATLDYTIRWTIDNNMNLPLSSFEAMNRMASLSFMGVTGFFTT